MLWRIPPEGDSSASGKWLSAGNTCLLDMAGFWGAMLHHMLKVDSKLDVYILAFLEASIFPGAAALSPCISGGRKLWLTSSQTQITFCCFLGWGFGVLIFFFWFCVFILNNKTSVPEPSSWTKIK